MGKRHGCCKFQCLLCSEVYTENAFTSCKQFQGIFDSQIDTAQKNISHPSMILKEVRIRFVADGPFDLGRITVSIDGNIVNNVFFATAMVPTGPKPFKSSTACEKS